MADTQPSPEIVFETFTAFQRTVTLKAAVDLDVFTAIAEGTVTPAALVTRIGAAERGARSLAHRAQYRITALSRQECSLLAIASESPPDNPRR